MITNQDPKPIRRVSQLVTGDVYKVPTLSVWHRVERILPDGTMIVSDMVFTNGIPYWYKRNKPISHKAKYWVEVKE